MRKPKVTQYAVKFIGLWNTTLKSGGTVADVARELGLAVGSVSNYASFLRARGHRLDTFKSGPSRSRSSK